MDTLSEEKLTCQVTSQITEEDEMRVNAFRATLPVRISMSAAVKELVRAGLKAKKINKVDNGTVVSTRQTNQQ